MPVRSARSHLRKPRLQTVFLNDWSLALISFLRRSSWWHSSRGVPQLAVRYSIDADFNFVSVRTHHQFSIFVDAGIKCVANHSVAFPFKSLPSSGCLLSRPRFGSWFDITLQDPQPLLTLVFQTLSYDRIFIASPCPFRNGLVSEGALA